MIYINNLTELPISCKTC